MCIFTQDQKTLQIHSSCGHEMCDDNLETVPSFDFCPWCKEDIDLHIDNDETEQIPRFSECNPYGYVL